MIILTSKKEPEVLTDKEVAERLAQRKLELTNFGYLIQLKYPHICMNYSDFYRVTTVPALKQGFYDIKGRTALYRGEMGWFNNGKTKCWIDHQLDPGYIKIALNEPKTNIEGWTDAMSLKEKDSIIKIVKIIKLKAFW